VTVKGTQSDMNLVVGGRMQCLAIMENQQQPFMHPPRLSMTAEADELIQLLAGSAKTEWIRGMYPLPYLVQLRNKFETAVEGSSFLLNEALSAEDPQTQKAAINFLRKFEKRGSGPPVAEASGRRRRLIS